MKRRTFFAAAGSMLGAALVPRGRAETPPTAWQSLRLIAGSGASTVERTALEDAAGLFRRAIGATVPIVIESGKWGPSDVVAGCEGTTRSLPRGLTPASGAPGQFAVRGYDAPDGPRIAIAGVDPEGVRNGLYAWMERSGFAFFRDGEVLPSLDGSMATGPEAAIESRPAFRWRGDMIWDNYLGPRRYCAAVWSDAEWERALLFLARRGLNFLEFYPPLEYVLALAFPEARGLSEGAVWKSAVKHAMTKRVLARGRALGIQFMYVLNYGFFPEPIRSLYPTLEWANGHLCANQPELAAMADKTWRTLVAELGTDGIYAIRHRGEEGQSYSDPCRSVTKADGFRQAIGVLRAIDPRATITVWTWGEKLPDLFAALPVDVRAAHIRHGMGGVFADRGQGREQADGAASLPPDRRWLSGQFTVFGGNETLIQTPWSDAGELARDAQASLADGRCDGYFQWPEWSDTSPWISHVISRLAWAPTSFPAPETELRAYARARHGDRADAFLAGVVPILGTGHAHVTSTPRKRLVVPYWLSPGSLAMLEAARNGARTMAAALTSGDPSPRFARDLIDVFTWIGVRQAHVFEASACVHHRAMEQAAATAALDSASATWLALHGLLLTIPELSILDAAQRAGRAGELSDRFVDSFWTNACDFYGGYPLVMSPEAIELVCLPQLATLRQLMTQATDRRERLTLEAPGWFWHDFPDQSWADAVRKMPSEDAAVFERTMKDRLKAVAAIRTPASPHPNASRVAPSEPSNVDRQVTGWFVDRCLFVPLPKPIKGPTG